MAKMITNAPNMLRTDLFRTGKDFSSEILRIPHLALFYRHQPLHILRYGFLLDVIILFGKSAPFVV